MNPDPSRPFEPLLESARLARCIASHKCRTDPESGENCAWYHGTWPYLRLLGLGLSPTVHADFYREAVTAVIRKGPCSDVLVSGCADYSMFAHLYRIYQDLGMQLRCSINDICETPLHLCRWYADSISADIDVSSGHILEHETDRPYDLITTHAFLGYFDTDGRRRLFRKWRELLRPGGHVVLLHRLRSGHKEPLIRFNPQQSEDLCRQVSEKAEAYRGELDISVGELVAAVRTYTEKLVLYPVTSSEELEAIIREAGFELERFDILSTNASAAEKAPAPSVADGSGYMRIVARRED